MLEKLLQPEIRHERNVLLQCVRFTVQNNFFGVCSKEKQKDSKPEEISDQNTSDTKKNE